MVRAKRRPEPDLKRFARALVDLMTWPYWSTARYTYAAPRHRGTTARSGGTSAPPTGSPPAGAGSRRTRQKQNDDESPGHATTRTRSVNATVPTSRTVGIRPAKIDNLGSWWESELFDAAEQAALAHCDAFTAGNAPRLRGRPRPRRGPLRLDRDRRTRSDHHQHERLDPSRAGTRRNPGDRTERVGILTPSTGAATIRCR